MNTEFYKRENAAHILNVLHLEDNPRDRILVEEKLRSSGFACKFVEAKTRHEFEAALAGAKFDLILSDFSLPSYHGDAALAMARQTQPDAPFLFVSGTIGEERAVESLKSGATDYVIKGHLERLIPAIQRALREAADRQRRRQAEEDLRSSEERFRMVFDSAPIGVINADAEGRLMRTNRTLQQMLGYTEAELCGLSFKTITRGSCAMDRESFQNMVAGKTEKDRSEERYYCKDGTALWVQVTTSAIRTPTGRVQYFVTLVEDLSERKQAEEQMRDQATLLDMAADAILVKDAEGHVLSWNRGAEQLYGWRAEEVLGRKVTEFLYSDSPGYDLMRKGLMQNGDWSGELHQLTREGVEVIVSSRATLMRDENGNPKSILIINTDVTEKKQLEAQFLRAQRMESIGTLAGGIAHDLNNILAPISIATQILRMKPLDQDTAELVNRIETSAHRGADVVRQVLTFARGIEGERSLLQPRHLLREIIKIAQETFPKSINISYSIGEDLWPVMGDATQLHQVLLNLCVNARDAMSKGGDLRCTAENLLLEETSHLLPGAKAGPYLLLQVIDSGVGIPAHLREKIFEPFFTTKDHGKGTGLGLSTVMGIVKSHGGCVNVYSEPGRGTAFKIYLPAMSTPLAEPLLPTQVILPHGNGELILLVDDEAAIRDVTRKVLARHGYNVLTAVDGVDGLAVFTQQAGKIHLVISDMMMPRMEGLAMIRAIKNIEPNIRVIASSGLANLSDHTNRAEELKLLGVKDFLPKPCSAEKLLTTVHNLLV